MRAGKSHDMRRQVTNNNNPFYYKLYSEPDTADVDVTSMLYNGDSLTTYTLPDRRIQINYIHTPYIYNIPTVRKCKIIVCSWRSGRAVLRHGRKQGVRDPGQQRRAQVRRAVVRRRLRDRAVLAYRPGRGIRAPCR